MNAWPDLFKFEPAIAGRRPERELKPKPLLEKIFHYTRGILSPGSGRGRSYTARKFVKKVERYSVELEGISEDDLQQQIDTVRHQLRLNGLTDELIANSFALIRELSDQIVGMRHYHTQLVGGWLLLKGMVAEMPTGEGKTLTATLTAGTAAMSGLPVHVLTVNDYLTLRDSEEMKPIYSALGLSVGVIAHGAENEERQQAYSCDVLYCTSKEIVFDFLRDRIALGSRRHRLRHQVEPLFGNLGCHDQLLLQGLHFAIVDEADSVLIDEARTPLIISGEGGGKYEEEFLLQSLEISRALEQGDDFVIEQSEHRIKLTDAGREHLKESTKSLGPLWSGRIRREEIISQALSALYLFNLDEHYLIREDKIEIIDPLTGRITEGRAWERGLHQLIELKEGVEMSQQRDTLAKISYQNFFRHYLHLSGMTGTAQEVSRELWQVYALPVASVPSYRPSIRKLWPTRVFNSNDKKWKAIAERVQDIVDQDRAVLVGTGSVSSSEEASRVFQQYGIEFRVLNAKQDKEEADIISMAGQKGRVTIATSMAGRGTDIKLEKTVCNNGGLHVILSERYDSKRVDRQLAGRGARQGDPGSYESILSFEEIDYTSNLAKLFSKFAIYLGSKLLFGRLVALAALRLEQKNRERRSYNERRLTQKMDERQTELLSISGMSE